MGNVTKIIDDILNKYINPNMLQEETEKLETEETEVTGICPKCGVLGVQRTTNDENGKFIGLFYFHKIGKSCYIAKVVENNKVFEDFEFPDYS